MPRNGRGTVGPANQAGLTPAFRRQNTSLRCSFDDERPRDSAQYAQADDRGEHEGHVPVALEGAVMKPSPLGDAMNYDTVRRPPRQSLPTSRQSAIDDRSWPIAAGRLCGG